MNQSMNADRSRLTAFNLLLLLLLNMVAACTPEFTSEELLQRAQTALDDGDLKAAELDVKTVLQRSPDNAVARRIYGRVYLETMDAASAVDQFERSLKTRPAQITRVLLAKSLVMAGESSRLVDDWRTGRFASVESAAEFQAALALALLGQANEDEARDAISRALASDQLQRDYVEVAAAIVSIQLDRDLPGAERRLLGVIDRSPDHAQAYSVLGVIAAGRKRFEEAERFFSAAIRANPNRIGDQLQLVETQIRLGKQDVADGNLARLERQLPKNPTVNLLRGQLMFDRAEYADAVDIFNQILSVNPNQLAAILLSANANLRLEKFIDAQRQFEDYVALQPGNLTVQLQLAELYTLTRQPIRAESIARAVLEIESDNTAALTMLATSLATQGRHIESAQVLAVLSDLNPDSLSARLALGSQQLVAGEVDAGLAVLERAVEESPDSGPARERLIQARLATQDLAGATSEAESYVAMDPENVRALLHLGRVRLQAGEVEGAGELFDAVLRRDPENVVAYGGLAAIAVTNQDFSGAREIFEDALQLNPGDLYTSINLAAVLEQLAEFDQLEKVLVEALDANPDAVEVRLPLARLELFRGEASKAIDLLRPSLKDYGDDPRVLETITRAYVVNEQFESAILSSEKLVSTSTGSVRALELGARVAIAASEMELAERYLRSSIQLDDARSDLRKLLVDVLLNRGLFQEAANEIDKLPPDALLDAPLLLVRGRLALGDSDPRLASRHFTAAHELDPSSATLLALTTAEWQLGLETQAIGRQANWLDTYPDDVVVRNDYAARLISIGDDETATAEYRRVLEKEPDSVIALNNLAWLLKSSDTTTALEYVKRADELAPESAQVKDTYAMVEMERGEYEAALKLNSRAMDLDGSSSDVMYNRASILVEADRRVEALDLLERLELDPSFQRKDKLRQLRERL